jgi:carboxypeptidase C (cathepsin A)
MVWVEKPIGTRIGVAYSTLKEAQQQTVALERDGYKIIEIVEATLPKPNVV